MIIARATHTHCCRVSICPALSGIRTQEGRFFLNRRVCHCEVKEPTSQKYNQNIFHFFFLFFSFSVFLVVSFFEISWQLKSFFFSFSISCYFEFLLLLLLLLLLGLFPPPLLIPSLTPTHPTHPPPHPPHTDTKSRRNKKDRTPAETAPVGRITS
jgi:hypothetical protein